MVRSYTCCKCGTKSEEETSITFHRFPFPSVHGSLRARVWAKYCFPDDDWTSDQSLHRLFKSHKMICGKHFDESSYCLNDKKLNKFAIPVEARGIMAELRDQQQQPQREEILPEPDVNKEITEDTSSSSHSTQDIIMPEPTASPTHIPLIKLCVCEKKCLKEIDEESLIELTPKKKKLYKRCRKNIVGILRLRRRMKKTKSCNRILLQSLNSDSAVNDMIKNKLGSSSYLLLQSQLKNKSQKLSGGCWTLEDKVLALGIYKRSISCYRLLKSLFCLPSISTLKGLLRKIPLQCGINEQIMETIKEITTCRIDNDNLCVLAFDEMMIRENVINPKSDQFDDYQDLASQERISEIATHALMFMAIGITKTWKQPIAFYYSGSFVTAYRLSVLIKEVLTACFKSGLKVIGTVCDLDEKNIDAINYLGSKNERPYFEHEGHEIVTIFDPPSLLICFRNNFLKHNIQFTQEIQINDQINSIGIAKWSHLEEFYDIDKMNPLFVFAPALTQQHLQPNDKQKLKVYLAAQVLSHSVAAGLFAKTSDGSLPQAAVATATVASNMDKLFDCMNGDTAYSKRGKYLTNMTSTSPHIQFFDKMKDFFKNMTFLGARYMPPSQLGWLRTLNGLERIFYNLQTLNINSLATKRLNLDPLKNCFGCIRSNYGSNPNPTSVQFIQALKTSIITNLTNYNKNRNCSDDNYDILNNFKIFLEKGCKQKKM